MTKEEAIKLIDDRMCFGRGEWSEHHKPEIDIYWQAGKMAIKALEAEPPAQPEPCEIEQYVETCEECGFCDTISRQQAIPPAQPKRGRWILDRSGAYCCSECMEPCAGYVMMKPRDKFCKMCGSRNEVTE